MRTGLQHRTTFDRGAGPPHTKTLDRYTNDRIGAVDMRYVLTAVTYVVSFIVVAAFTFGALMALANSSYVPWLVAHDLDGLFIGVVGWGTVLVVPALLAWFVWKRLGKKVVPQ